MDVLQTIRDFALKHKLTQRNLVVDHGGGRSLSFDLQVTPQEFLSLAEEAMERGEDGCIDTVSNAQRAARAQVKLALGSLGFETSKLRIGKQMQLLAQVGLIAPRILRKISEPRNLMEHQYRRPTITEAEDALDVAALFVEATNRVLGSFEDGYSIEKQVRGNCYNVMNVAFTNERQYSLTLYEERDSKTLITIHSEHTLFIPLHRVAVALSRETGQEHDPRVSSQFFALLDEMKIRK